MAYELTLAHSQTDVSFLISLAQVKHSANNESRVFRKKAVKLEESFFLNLMVNKLVKKLIKSADSLKTTAIAYVKVAEAMK